MIRVIKGVERVRGRSESFSCVVVVVPCNVILPTIGVDEFALVVDGVLHCLEGVAKDGGGCLFDSVSVHGWCLLDEWKGF